MPHGIEEIFKGEDDMYKILSVIPGTGTLNIFSILLSRHSRQGNTVVPGLNCPGLHPGLAT